MSPRDLTTQVIAHRGASSAHPPGNTIVAIEAARMLGAGWVELDVRRTADGSAAVHHDPCLPDGRLVAEVEGAQLPDWVPLLDAALEACEPMGVNIEIKNDPSEEDFDDSDALVEIVCNRLAVQRLGQACLLSSFRWEAMERARRVAPELSTALLGLDLNAELIEAAVQGGHSAVHPYDDFINGENVAAARSRGLDVNAWTVDDPTRISELAGFGVAGVVTNRPDLAVEALRS